MTDNALMESWLTPYALFLILFLIGAGVFYTNETPITTIGKAYSERAGVNGGLSASDIDGIKNALAENGLDPNKFSINIYPSEAMNITSTKYAKRGTVMTLKIESNDLGLLDSLFKKLGNTTDIKNKANLYVMSEKP